VNVTRASAMGAAHADSVPGVSSPADDAASLAYRSYVLVVLVVVYTFNFIDRQIVGILAVPIKSELGLSDSQLGLMGGLAFALFYTLLGIPIARLADKVSRTGIMTAALALWSVMTAVCGLTHSFAQLFMARMGVGVGEAGGVAPAYSLICDYFPTKERARALSVYSFGIPIGAGVLADRYGETRRAMYAFIPATAFVATVPFYVAGVLSTTLWISFAVLLVPTALGLVWLGPVLAAVQHLVPGNMRATASALFLFINNLIGIGLGTALIGIVSDFMRLRFGGESLRYAILAGTGFYLMAAALLFFAGKKLARDWV
jgi:MFS family permease